MLEMEKTGEGTERAPAAAVIIVILVLVILAGAYYYISLASVPPQAPGKHDAGKSMPSEKKVRPEPPAQTPQKPTASGT